MPLLGALIQTLFGYILARIADDAVRKATVFVAAGAAFVAAVGVLMTVFNTQLAPLAAQAFSTQYGQFIGLAFPPVAGTCMATFTTVWLACGTYRLVLNVTQVTAQG